MFPFCPRRHRRTPHMSPWRPSIQSSEIISSTTTHFMEMRSESDIERSVEKLLQDLREIVHEGEELLKAGMEDSSERGSAAREKFSSALEAAKETQHRIQQRAAE